MSKNVSSAVGLVAIAASLAFFPAQAASPVKVGQLECAVSDTDKKLFSTHLVLACKYIDANGNNAGSYQGSIHRTGLDIGNIKTTQFTWIVGTAGDPANVKLDGSYIGAEAGASAGAGAGANYLTGGFNDEISLQPYSVEGKSGIGLAIGGQKLVLKAM
jgi:hypothetical protein